MRVFDIAEFLAVAEAVLEIDSARLRIITNIGAAESALAAPFASFGGHDFYEHPVQRAAILASRINRNHALPDGNKRVALILMDDYLRSNGWRLTAKPQEIDRAFRAVAGREQTEEYFIAWVCSRTERI
jgi:death-on-curing protein